MSVTKGIVMTEAEWLVSNHPTPMVLHIVETTGYRKLARLVLAFHKINDRGVDEAEVEQLLDDTHLTRAFPWGDCKNLVVGCAWACTDGRDNGKLGADAVRDIIGNPFRPVELPGSLPKHKCSCGSPMSMTADHQYGLGLWHCQKDRKHTTRQVTLEEMRLHYQGGCPWLTPTVLSLAHAAHNISCRGCDQCYDGWLPGECIRPCPNRIDATLDPLRLVVLADALEEAGCRGEPEKGRWYRCKGCGVKFPGVHKYSGCEDCVGADVEPTIAPYTKHPIVIHLRSPGPHWRGCWAVDLILGKE